MSYPIARKHPRFAFSELPWFLGLSIKNEWQEDRPPRLEAKNISLGGLKFLCNIKIALFSEIEIQVYRKDTGQLVSNIKGKTVRLEEIDIGHGERLYGIAIAFHPGESDSLQSAFSSIMTS